MRKKSLGISAKLSFYILFLVGGVVAFSFLFFNRTYRANLISTAIEKASAYTSAALETQNNISRLHSDGLLTTDELQSAGRRIIPESEDFRNSELYQTIPVIAGLTTAQAAVESSGMNLRITAFNPRNPQNDPASDTLNGGFRAALLRTLREQTESGGEEQIYRINQATNTIYYMRAIRFEQSCLTCHGNPRQSQNGDGADKFGFKMENWKAGAIHGAYEVAIPVNSLNGKLADFTIKSVIIYIAIGLAIMIIMAILVYRMISKPLVYIAESVQRMADGDMDARIDFYSGDEIGALAESLQIMNDYLRKSLLDIRKVSDKLSESAEELCQQCFRRAGSVEELNTQVDTVSAETEQIEADIAALAPAADQSLSALKDIEDRSERMSFAVTGMVGLAQNTAENIRAMASTGREFSGKMSELTVKLKEMTGNLTEISVESAQNQQISQNSVSHNTQAEAKLEFMTATAEQIDRIARVYRDLADQTNILALNIAIRAADAGDGGESSALIAREVKDIAKQVAEATNEIENQTEAVRNSASTAISSIKEISLYLSECADKSRTMTDKSRGGAETAADIAAAVTELAKTSIQIAKSVNKTAAIAEEIAKNAQDTSGAIENILSKVKEFNLQVEERVEDEEKIYKKSRSLAESSSLLLKLMKKFTIGED